MELNILRLTYFLILKRRTLALFSLIERSLTWYCEVSFTSTFTTRYLKLSVGCLLLCNFIFKPFAFLRWGTHLYMSLVCSSICCAPYIRKCTSCDHKFWYTYVKWQYLQASFFHFLKILIVWVVTGGKTAKSSPK